MRTAVNKIASNLRTYYGLDSTASDYDVFELQGEDKTSKPAIMNAYKELARIHHPDKNVESPESEAAANKRFKELDEVKDRLLAQFSQDQSADENISIHEACAKGNLARVLRLIKDPNTAVNEKDASQLTPFETAVKHEQWSIVVALLDEQQRQKRIIKHQASTADNALVARPKNTLDIDLAGQDEAGNTLLHRICLLAPPAISTNSQSQALVHKDDTDFSRDIYYQLVENILSQMPAESTNARNKQGKAALHLVCEAGAYEAFAPFLYNSLVDMNAIDAEGNSAFHIACNANWSDIALSFVHHPRVDLNQRNAQGRTAFALCVMKEHRKLATNLFTQATRTHKRLAVKEEEKTFLIDVNVPDNEGETVFFRACKYNKKINNVTTIQFLTRLCSETMAFNWKNADGHTPLFVALRVFATAKELLSSRVTDDVYFETAEGETIFSKADRAELKPYLAFDYIYFKEFPIQGIHGSTSVSKKRTYLAGACEEGKTTIVREVLEYLKDIKDILKDDVERDDIGDKFYQGVENQFKWKDQDGNNILNLAIINKHIDVARLLLVELEQEHINFLLQSCNSSHETAFGLACDKGLLELIPLFLEKGAQLTVDQANELFLFSCIHGNIKMIEFLRKQTFASEIDYNARFYADGPTGFLRACDEGHADIVSYLLKIRSVDFYSDRKGSALFHACSNGHFDVVTALLNDGYSDDSNAQPYPSFVRDWGASVYIAHQANHHKISNYILNQKVAVEHLDNIVSYACQKGCVELLQYLISRKFTINWLKRHQNNKSYLYQACEDGHVELAAFLLAQAPLTSSAEHEFTQTEQEGSTVKTPLDIACKGGHADIVALLLKQPLCQKEWLNRIPSGKQNDHLMPEHITPLGAAAKNGHLVVVEMLLAESSIQPNASQDNTPLHIVVREKPKQAVEIVKRLVLHPKINASKKNSKGETATEVLGTKPGIYAQDTERNLWESLSELITKAKRKEANKKWFNSQINEAGEDIEVLGPLLLQCYSKACPDIAQSLLVKNPRLVNYVNDDGETALWLACNADDSFSISDLLKREGIDINIASNEQGWTPLHLACRNGNVRLIALLLDDPRIDHTMLDKEGRTPLDLACATYNLDAVKVFFEKNKYDVANPKNAAGFTPLHFANDEEYIIAMGQKRLVLPFLIEKGIDPFIQDNKGRTAFFIACEKGDSKKALYLLDKFPSILEVLDNSGRSFMHAACQGARSYLIKELIKRVPYDFHKPDNSGITPLMIACEQKLGISVEALLVDTKLEFNAVDQQDRTAFFIACANDRQDTVKLLLTRQTSIDLNKQNIDGKTALMIASEKGHEKIVMQILNATVFVDLSKMDNTGKTVLDLAAANGHANIVNALLKKLGKKVTPLLLEGVLKTITDAGHGKIITSLKIEGKALTSGASQRMIMDFAANQDSQIQEQEKLRLEKETQEKRQREKEARRLEEEKRNEEEMRRQKEKHERQRLQEIENECIRQQKEEQQRQQLEEQQRRHLEEQQRQQLQKEKEHIRKQKENSTNFSLESGEGSSSHAQAGDGETEPPPPQQKSAVILHEEFSSAIDTATDKISAQKQKYLQALFDYFGVDPNTKKNEALEFVGYLIANKDDYLLSIERNTLRDRHNPKAKSFIMALRFFAEQYPNTRGRILSLVQADPSVLEWHGKDSIAIQYHDGNRTPITVNLPTIEKRGPCYGVNSRHHDFKYIKVDDQGNALPAATYAVLDPLFRDGAKDKQAYINNLVLYFNNDYSFNSDNSDSAKYPENSTILKQEAYNFVASFLTDTGNYCRQTRTAGFLFFSPQGYRAKDNMTKSYCELLRFFIDKFGSFQPADSEHSLETLVINALTAKLSNSDFNNAKGQNPLKYLSGKQGYVTETLGELKQNDAQSALAWIPRQR